MKSREIIILLVLLLLFFKSKKSSGDNQTKVDVADNSTVSDNSSVVDAILETVKDEPIKDVGIIGTAPDESLFTTPDLVNDDALTWQEIIDIRAEELQNSYNPINKK